MLKVTGSKMKVNTRPSKATVVARPAGFEARKQKWAEEDARAKAYRESYDERKDNAVKAMRAANLAKGAITRAAREVERRKPKRLWDNYEEVAVIQKSGKLRFLIAACTRDGFRCVTIREFYKRKRDGQWLPARDGILVPIMVPIGRTKEPDPNNPPKMIHPMQEFISAIIQAADVAREMELSDPEKAVWLKYYTEEETKNEDY